MKSPIAHAEFLTSYFLQQVSPALVTVILKQEEQDFSDNEAFLAIKMVLSETDEHGHKKHLYAFIEMPKSVNRLLFYPQ